MLTLLKIKLQCAIQREMKAELCYLKVLRSELKIYVQSVRIIHQQDLQQGYGSIHLPFAVEKIFKSKVTSGFSSLFPSGSLKTRVVEKFVFIIYTRVVYKKP